MKDKKKNFGLYVFIAVIVILFIPIISDYMKNRYLVSLTSEEVSTKIKNGESFVLYLGEDKSKESKKLVNYRNNPENTLTEYGIYSSSTYKGVKGKKIAIYIEGDLQKTYKNLDPKSIKDDINAYYIGEYNKKTTYFKTAKNYKKYKEIVNSDVATMAVFGRNSCSWCNKFKPVYNAVAEKYNLDIYYFDSDSYNSSDYVKIINMDLTVPAKCNSNGEEFKLSDGFGTPLTIITKDGEVVDCIGGYKDRANLIEILKNNDIISE